jgi:hypothetical protein
MTRLAIPAGLGQTAYRVHRTRLETHQDIASADQRQCLLLSQRTMRDRAPDLRVEPCITGDLLGVYLVALAVAVSDCPQIAHVGHDHHGQAPQSVR